MTHYLRITYHSLGIPETEPQAGAKPRLLYARCNSEDPRTCELFVQIAGLALKDRKAALSALRKLVDVAASGKPLTEFYDKKQCHLIHEFRHLDKDRSIWRIWKGDVVRVTFLYDEHSIILLNIFTKYEDKLTNAQKKALVHEAIAYLDSQKAKSLRYIEKAK